MEIIFKKCGGVRAEKRTVQLSVHSPLPYLRAQVIMQAAMVRKGWKEQRTDCNKVRQDVVPLIHSSLGKREFFSAFHC